MNVSLEFDAHYVSILRIVKSKIPRNTRNRDDRVSSALCHAWEIFANLSSVGWNIPDCIRIAASTGAKRGMRLDALLCERADGHTCDVFSKAVECLPVNEDGQPQVTAPDEWSVAELELQPLARSVADMIISGSTLLEIASSLGIGRHTLEVTVRHIGHELLSQ